MNNGKFRTCDHRGGLKEAFETERDLDPVVGQKLIDSGIYEFYAFDERIGADRYLLLNFQSCLGMPTWLHVYKEK